MDKPDFCESIYKGKNKEEIKRGLNQKWVEIINSCVSQKNYNNSTSDYQKSDKQSKKEKSKNQTCSANLIKRS